MKMSGPYESVELFLYTVGAAHWAARRNSRRIFFTCKVIQRYSIEVGDSYQNG